VCRHGWPFGAALADVQRKCTHYTLLPQSSSPRGGLKHKASTRYRQIIDSASAAIAWPCRYLVDNLSIFCRCTSMGLRPSPPGSGLPGMDIPSGPWGKAMDGGGQPFGLTHSPPTALPHLPTPAACRSTIRTTTTKSHFVLYKAKTSLCMHDTGKASRRVP
jgi:hypothetical protein